VVRSVRSVDLAALLLVFVLGIGQLVGPGSHHAWRLLLVFVTDEVAAPSSDGLQLEESDDALADAQPRSGFAARPSTGRASAADPRARQHPALLAGVTRSPPLT
jgi:hypothetical protein